MLPLRLSTVITEMNIHQIVNSVFTSNAYILSVEGKDGHVLIDIGDITPYKAVCSGKVRNGTSFVSDSYSLRPYLWYKRFITIVS